MDLDHVNKYSNNN